MDTASKNAYAIQGYAVDALDYVLKPVSYFALSQRLNRVLLQIGAQGFPVLGVVVCQRKSKHVSSPFARGEGLSVRLTRLLCSHASLR